MKLSQAVTDTCTETHGGPQCGLGRASNLFSLVTYPGFQMSYL